jgi:hypothetical protein
MSTSQRVSRGFHRLGLFLAAIPLLAGLAGSAYEVLSGWQEERATWSAGISLHDFLIGAATFPRFWLFAIGPMVVALLVALVIYGLVRVIGWVISGFAAT